MQKYNYGETKPVQREDAPVGKHHFVVTGYKEGTTGNQDEKVDVFVTVDDQEFNKSVKHTVTFFPAEHKAAGITLHFLKCIGEPHTGEFTPTPKNWLGKRFFGEIALDTYMGKTRPKLIRVYPATDGITRSNRVKDNSASKDDEVPF